MFEKKVHFYNFNVKRKAEFTIEIALSLALLVVILFLVLGLFSNNLQAIAEHARIYKFFS